MSIESRGNTMSSSGSSVSDDELKGDIASLITSPHDYDDRVYLAWRIIAGASHEDSIERAQDDIGVDVEILIEAMNAGTTVDDIRSAYLDFEESFGGLSDTARAFLLRGYLLLREDHAHDDACNTVYHAVKQGEVTIP